MSIGAAIKARWSSSGLLARIPGGLWYEKAPQDVEWPHQCFLVLGNVDRGRTSTSTRRRVAFEIHTYYKPVEGEDPQEALAALVEATEQAFHDQLLTVDGYDTMLVTQNDSRTFEEDVQVYRGLNEFDFLLQKSR